MKVGFVITNHHNEKTRPHGRDLLVSCLESLKQSCEHPYEVFIVDNESDKQLTPEPEHYHYIEDQSKGGLTYAWNYGIKWAYDEGCDIIMNINDDITFDTSINSLIEILKTHKHRDVSVYGPVTNEGGTSTEHQWRSGVGENIIEATHMPFKGKHQGYAINGFFYAFTKECWERYEVDGNFFSIDIREAWGGQEEEFHCRNWPKGLKSFIVESCYIHHSKLMDWKSAREKYKHPKREKPYWEYEYK
tara:strand:+ start:844 stop:1581 length:738 start_codon:yes stop_codon:yes gene_type:complete